MKDKMIKMNKDEALLRIREGLDYFDKRSEILTIRKDKVVAGKFEVLLSMNEFFALFKDYDGLRRIEPKEEFKDYKQKIFTIYTPLRCVCYIVGEIDRKDLREQYGIELEDIKKEGGKDEN